MVKNSKEELVAAIRAAGGLKSIRVGTELMIYCGNLAAVVKKQAVEKAIRTGAYLIVDGVKEWYVWTPKYDVEKFGSDRYDWHRDGNRVRTFLNKHVCNADGSITVSTVRTAWRVLE